ncbi:MAG: hypothetical protein PHT32_03345, partial [Candidatus Omnitrophica bacterium]|nr:hypothetical protein [Candidatus Omnitrophota bacterium]
SAEPAPEKTKAMSPLFSTTKTTAKKDTSSLGWGRDPFMLEDSSSGDLSKVSSLKLMGITSSKDSPHKAIINNIIVSVGSTIGKFRVLDISNDTVLVSDGKETFSLKIVR